jgi:hypothetical protein
VPSNSTGSDAGPTILRLITPNPDRLPNSIRMVAVCSMDELSVVEMKPDVVVFQEWLPRPAPLWARPRLIEETIGMRVEKRIAMIVRAKPRENL